MTDTEHEMEQSGSSNDPGRARKRKLKRGGTDVAIPEGTTSRRNSERHASTHDGPTIRERLVSANVKLPPNPLPGLQDKLNDNLKAGARKSQSKTASTGEGTTHRSPRRKSEDRRNESLFEATSHAETKRYTDPGKGFLPRKKAREFDARSEASPPVMVRGGMSGMAFGRVASSRLSKKKPPRRRIDVPLNVPGAEMRLPTVAFPRLGWRAVSLLMVLMMAASLFLIWKAPVFQVNTMQAVGLKRLTVSDLNAVMRTFGK